MRLLYRPDARAAASTCPVEQQSARDQVGQNSKRCRVAAARRDMARRFTRGAPRVARARVTFALNCARFQCFCVTAPRSIQALP
jgi:hypothetical protein